MAVYNYDSGEINIKIVYYGPGISGKTTNLEHMYAKLPRENKGKMVSMKTRTDRTLFFDFLPIEIGDLSGMKVRFLLYTVPGQVYYNATRKLVLKGVDAVVFVADSAPDRMDDNRESLDNLEENLNELGLSLESIPWVLQYNKRDLPGCMEKGKLDELLNERKVEVFEAVATTGKGVYQTFEGIARKVFIELKKNLKDHSSKENRENKQTEDEIAAEVVAGGDRKEFNSETDKSESFGYAEEREEEHESVSEFVDNVLKEGELADQGIDLGATREGYEEYGHVVELGGDREAAEEKQDSVEAPVATKAPENEFINDPLDNLSDNPSEGPEDENPAEEAEEENPAVAAPRTREINVPVEMSEDEIRDGVPVKVILEIKVTS